MERLEQEGEQYLQKEEGGNQQQSGGYDQQQSSGNYDQQQQSGGNDMNERSNQQQDSSNSGNSSGGGFMKNMEGNTEDAYINNGTSSMPLLLMSSTSFVVHECTDTTPLDRGQQVHDQGGRAGYG